MQHFYLGMVTCRYHFWNVSSCFHFIFHYQKWLHSKKKKSLDSTVSLTEVAGM